MTVQRAGEDYLEAMLMLQEEKGIVRSIDVAAKLDVTKPSVTYATKKLKTDGHITMDEDGSIQLTESGMAIAQRMLERHEKLADFLIGLGVSEATAREDACMIEHDISEETFNAICSHAGFCRGRES